jgi:hypothetical protein
MKTPTAGTEVYKPVAYTGDGSTRAYSVGFPIDLSINMTRTEYLTLAMRQLGMID